MGSEWAEFGVLAGAGVSRFSKPLFPCWQVAAEGLFFDEDPFKEYRSCRDPEFRCCLAFVVGYRRRGPDREWNCKRVSWPEGRRRILSPNRAHRTGPSPHTLTSARSGAASFWNAPSVADFTVARWTPFNRECAYGWWPGFLPASVSPAESLRGCRRRYRSPRSRSSDWSAGIHPQY